MYAVILAGGGGTRLWPLSSPERPKPFLPLLGERTLLQLTADRLDGLVDADSIFVVTDRRYEQLVREQLPDAVVLAEPVGRNTAAAIALATVALDRAEDEVMLVLPADQIVDQVDEFRVSIRAAGFAARGVLGVAKPIVTLGITPTHPATSFGYVSQTGPVELIELRSGEKRRFYEVARFIEKPDIERATQLVEDHLAYWNAGIFAWRRETIRSAFERDAADILAAMTEGAEGNLAAAYAKVRATSIDYAILEPSSTRGSVVVSPMDVGWNDLGSWTSLLAELGLPGIQATIAPAGEPFEAGPDDLAVWRLASGRLASASGVDATMVETSGPVAILREARTFKARIDDLLARCSTPEAHS